MDLFNTTPITRGSAERAGLPPAPGLGFPPSGGNGSCGHWRSATSPSPASSSATGPGGSRRRCSPPMTRPIGARHLAELDPVVFDPGIGPMVITYQTFVVRTPKHTILVDTCTGEDKGYPPPMDFPKQPWLDGFARRRAALRGYRLRLLHPPAHRPLRLEHPCWRTDAGCRPSRRRNTSSTRANTPPGRKRPSAATNPPGNVWRYNCEPVVAAGQALLVDDDFSSTTRFGCADARPFALPLLRQHPLARPARRVTGDLMHHALQVREPGLVDHLRLGPGEAAASRRKFLNEVADTPAVMLPTTSPAPPPAASPAAPPASTTNS